MSDENNNILPESADNFNTPKDKGLVWTPQGMVQAPMDAFPTPQAMAQEVWEGEQLDRSPQQERADLYEREFGPNQYLSLGLTEAEMVRKDSVTPGDDVPEFDIDPHVMAFMYDEVGTGSEIGEGTKKE